MLSYIQHDDKATICFRQKSESMQLRICKHAWVMAVVAHTLLRRVASFHSTQVSTDQATAYTKEEQAGAIISSKKKTGKLCQNLNKLLEVMYVSYDAA